MRFARPPFIVLVLVVVALLGAAARAADPPEGARRVVLHTGLVPAAGLWNFTADDGTTVVLDLAYDAKGRLVGTATTGGTSRDVACAVRRTPTGAKFHAKSHDRIFDLAGQIDPATSAATGTLTTRAGRTKLRQAVTGTTPAADDDTVSLFLRITRTGGRLSGTASVEPFTGLAVGPATVSGKVRTDRQGRLHATIAIRPALRGASVSLTGVSATDGSFAGSAKIALPGIRVRVPFAIHGDPPAGTVVADTAAPVDRTEDIALADGDVVLAAKDEVLVFLREDVTAAELAAVQQKASDLGAALVGSVPDARMLQLDVGPDGSESGVWTALRAMPGVVSAGPNVMLAPLEDAPAWNPLPPTTIARRSPRPAAKSRKADGVPSFPGDWWVEAIDAPGAWSAVADATAKPGKIGIIDVGLPADQPYIDTARLLRVDPYGQPVVGDGSASAFDLASGFGTHGMVVAGLAAGYADTLTVKARGVAWGADVIAVDAYPVRCTNRFCFPGPKLVPTSSAVAGVLTALARGARVVNLSLGPSDIDEATPSATRQRRHQEDRESYSTAVAAAVRNNALLVFAAGNDGEKNDDQLLPEGSAADPLPWATHAVIVGATASDGSDAGFSVMGDVVSLAAPGVDVGFKSRLLSFDLTDSGTSFSAPLVSGTASILWQVAPDLSAAEARQLLVSSAKPVVVTPHAPKLLLDAGAAVASARDLGAVPVETLPPVTLSGGETAQLHLWTKVPESVVPAMDVLLVVDVSGSFSDDIATLKNRAGAIVADLGNRNIDVRFGVASFADFPISPWDGGSSTDEAYYLNQPITSDTNTVLDAIDALTVFYGGDWPESQLAALVQAAKGDGIDINRDGNYTGLGDIAPTNPGWRPGALRVLVLATDATFHDPGRDPGYPGPSFATTVSTLKSAGCLVIGLASGGSTQTQADLSAVATPTGGSVLALSSDSREIAQAVASGIDTALANLRVTAQEVSGAGWMSASTDVAGVRPGDDLDLDVTLTGLRDRGAPGIRQSYPIDLWMKAGSAVLKRFRVVVNVPSGN